MGFSVHNASNTIENGLVVVVSATRRTWDSWFKIPRSGSALVEINLALAIWAGMKRTSWSFYKLYVIGQVAMQFDLLDRRYIDRDLPPREGSAVFGEMLIQPNRCLVSLAAACAG